MNKLVLIILAIFLPPIAVFLKSGLGKDLIINIVLCILMFLPGMIHAIWLVTK
ncbi:YqaE/Pmp3 family membrane protein [Pleionea sp. CnH1-48]|uniref:YqaE/Pmp3 family membrane protein n=1 Tax=Pleionea sp. CnH1-48 TaxID=2954494 RepID=UPI0020975FEB|nr:YqaE/Pmp3 family membrane protein [Pleionea sp. CnH1-48]MCO7224497.1 YqaE/Pmp3 family membrane protein [Pleionea sp. CnH1-48]